MRYLWLMPGRDEVPRLVSGGLVAALAGMIGVEKDAGTKRLVIGIQAANRSFKPTHVDADADLHFEESYDVGDGRDAQTEALPQFHRVVLSLRPDVPRHDGSL